MLFVCIAKFAYHCFVQQTSEFKDLVLQFIDVTTFLRRRRWEKKHSDRYPSPDSLSFAMFAPHRSFDPLEIPPILRSFIDEWIDTGFQSDGTERPYQRNFRLRNRKEGESPWEYFIDAPMVEAPRSLQAVVRLFRGELIVPIGTRFYQIQSAYGSCAVVPIQLDGTVEFINDAFFAEANAETCAARIFLKLLSSEARYTLMRCNQCRKLFAPKRKPAKIYIRGWYCKFCRNSAAAGAATSAARKHKTEQRLALAANAFLDFHRRPRRTTASCTQHIVEQMNSRLPWQMRAKKNWVTRNLTNIQAEADKKGSKRNAKG